MREFEKLRWSPTRWSAVVSEDGAAGCRASHRAIWQHIVDNNIAVAAVFEDDICFSPRFSTIAASLYAELPPDWDIWHLHGAKAKPLTGMSGRRVFALRPAGKCWGSHGYLITKSAAQKLLQLNSDRPVDVILSSVFTTAGGKVFCTHTSVTLCFQTGNDTDIPATEQLAFWQRLRKRYCR